MWEIRPAAEDDAAPLSELAERTFRDAFAARNTVSDMDLHCSRAYGPEMQRDEIRDPDTCTLVVEHRGGLVAFAQFRRGLAPTCVVGTSPVELRRIYVLGPWHGTGLAAELMAAVVDRARQWGGDVLWLGVWERNPRAIGFYRKRGFAEAGHQSFLLGSDPQRDLVMVMPLDETDRSPSQAPRAPG